MPIDTAIKIPDEVLQTIQQHATEDENNLKCERTKHFIKIIDELMMGMRESDYIKYNVISIPTSKDSIEYTVYFPKTIQFAVQDIMNDSEPLYMDQILPLKVDCITYFNDNFNRKINSTDYCDDIDHPYMMRSDLDRNKKFDIMILNRDDNSNGDYISTITIHINYIIDDTVKLFYKINKLNNELYEQHIEIEVHHHIIDAHTLKQNELNDELFTQQRVIDSQVLKIHELDDELYTQQNVIDTQNLKIDKLSNRDTAGTATQCLINIRKLYETHNIKEDCPVCYEVIKPSALMMPACGHIICKSCMVHCKDKCPICRVCYNRYDKHIRI